MVQSWICSFQTQSNTNLPCLFYKYNQLNYIIEFPVDEIMPSIQISLLRCCVCIPGCYYSCCIRFGARKPHLISPSRREQNPRSYVPCLVLFIDIEFCLCGSGFVLRTRLCTAWQRTNGSYPSKVLIKSSQSRSSNEVLSRKLLHCVYMQCVYLNSNLADTFA